MLFYMLIALL